MQKLVWFSWYAKFNMMCHAFGARLKCTDAVEAFLFSADSRDSPCSSCFLLLALRVELEFPPFERPESISASSLHSSESRPKKWAEPPWHLNAYTIPLWEHSWLPILVWLEDKMRVAVPSSGRIAVYTNSKPSTRETMPHRRNVKAVIAGRILQSYFVPRRDVRKLNFKKQFSSLRWEPDRNFLGKYAKNKFTVIFEYLVQLQGTRGSSGHHEALLAYSPPIWNQTQTQALFNSPIVAVTWLILTVTVKVTVTVGAYFTYKDLCLRLRLRPGLFLFLCKGCPY